MILSRKMSLKWSLMSAIAALSLVVAGGALSLTGYAATEESRQEQYVPPRPSAVERTISKYVATLLSKVNYKQQPLNDDISRQLFTEYFERLDSNKSFFLASDIDDFRSANVILDDLLFQGNVDFGFDVYERFRQRVRQRFEYVQERLEKPFDFTRDETLLLDRSDEEWCRTEAELDELWRRRLKNNLLVYEMMEDGAKENESGQSTQDAMEDPESEGAAAEDITAKPPAPAPQSGETKEADAAEAKEVAKDDQRLPQKDYAALTPKTPKERVLRFYERYLDQVEERQSIEILELYLSALARIYDPHSTYMAPDTEEDFDIAMKLSLQGIGALLTTEDALVKVVSILPGGPAEADGRLKAGDRIIAVTQKGEDPVDVIDMPLRKVVRMIRGPKGTTVYLTVLPSGKPLGSVPNQIAIVRDEVKLTEQEAKLTVKETTLPPLQLDGTVSGKPRTASVAVIELPSFYSDFQARDKGKKDYKSSTRDVRRLLAEAEEQGIEALILDLRGNGGGALDEAVRLAGLFMAEGPMVQVRHPNGKIERRFDPDPDIVYEGALLVLVDHLSASASEIVAAAIQDYHRGVIVGEKSTHGKGTVQSVYHLDKRLGKSPIFRNQKTGSVKLTMGKFYRVTGGSTQVRGVTPDITFPSFMDHMELGEEHLEHVLPWDQVRPVAVTSSVDVRPYIDELRKRSDLRRERSAEYRERLDTIATFAERREKETTPLQRAEREKKQEEDERWSEKLESFKIGRSSDDENETENDYILDEAFRIAADLILLQEGISLGSNVQVTGLSAQEEPAPVEEPVAAEVQD